MRFTATQGLCPIGNTGRQKSGEHFVLFYSPILQKSVLPLPFFQHWMLLLFAIYTLFLPKLHLNDLKSASSCLTKLVAQVEDLYGKMHMSYNIHCLIHLADIQMWGPLWTNSAFLSEDMNEKLLELFYGTQAVPTQIFKYFFFMFFLPESVL